MLHAPLERPGKVLRELMDQGVVVMPGAFNALSAIAARRAGAAGIYLSGGAVTNAHLGVPDIALITLDEMSGIAARVCHVVEVPVISDADTGFGEAWNVARTVIEFERAGVAGIHIEDQVSPKRCGHLAGKQVIEAEHMVTKIRAACEARKDPSFLIIARTDAYALEGMNGAVARAKEYVRAGADIVFPEGLDSEEAFAEFRRQIDVPLLANMTEFGVTPIIPARRFADIGYQIVIFPVTALRATLKTMQDLYADLVKDGTQEHWLDRMCTRKQLYETVEYDRYEDRDAMWARRLSPE